MAYVKTIPTAFKHFGASLLTSPPTQAMWYLPRYGYLNRVHGGDKWDGETGQKRVRGVGAPKCNRFECFAVDGWRGGRGGSEQHQLSVGQVTPAYWPVDSDWLEM